MKHANKIKQLIQTKTGTNNCLALQLMQSLWEYSFEEALLNLKFQNNTFGDYTINLLDIKIEYLYEHNANVDYIFIRRKIHYKNQLLEGQYKDIYQGEPSDQKGSIEGLNDEESVAVIKDLKQISPIIEALFLAK